MSWAEVKKINSDMSTPLDELFKNSFVLINSDNEFDIIESVLEQDWSIPLQPSSSADEYVDRSMLKFKMNGGNTATIKFVCSFKIYFNILSSLGFNPNFYYKHELKVFKNGTQVASSGIISDSRLITDGVGTTIVSGAANFSKLLEFKKNDVFECVLSVCLESNASGTNLEKISTKINAGAYTDAIIYATPYLYAYTIDKIEEE